MHAHPYLNFDGHTEEAMRFYAAATGGTLTPFHRFGDMPGDMPLTDEQKRRVMHVGIDLPSGAKIMASDTLPGFGPDWSAGNHISISLHPETRAQADAVFAALAEGGIITSPLADQFWGDYFGSLTDRFGVQWMVNCGARA
jgi:PhnB protein